MVKYNRGLNATFQALADPTRRALVAALARGQASVTELARPHRMSLPAVMKHLRVLQKAGLVSYSRGHIEITDIDGLRKTCCECYAAVQRQCDRLLSAAR